MKRKLITEDLPVISSDSDKIKDKKKKKNKTLIGKDGQPIEILRN